jgi:hypothetical protein
MSTPEDPHCPRCGTRLNRNATHNPGKMRAKEAMRAA